MAIRRGHADDIARIIVEFGNHQPFTDRGVLTISVEGTDVGITSITAGNGLSGGSITTSGTIAIDTAVTADVSTAQELTNKTITAPVVKTGLTASGSASNDFSGSTGAFKTSSGANTLSGDTTVTSGKTFTTGAGEVFNSTHTALVAQTEQAMLQAGVLAFTSTSFADIGDSATTGWADASLSVPTTKTYTIRVRVNGVYGGASQAEFQLLIDGSAAAGQQLNRAIFVTSVYNSVDFYLSASLTSGSHTFRLQAKVPTNTMNFDGNNLGSISYTTRTITILQ